MTSRTLSFLQIFKARRTLIVGTLLAAVLLFTNLGAYSDFVRAESYFALGARLMFTENNWLAPHAPDEPVLNKPPLQYWLTGVSYKIFGVSYSSARVPSAIAALALLVVVYLLSARLNDERAGLLSAALLATSYLLYTFARTAMSDMLLALSVTASLACFILALSEKSFRPALVYCAYIFAGLGVLTKGPVAIVLTGGPLLLELLFSRDIAMLKKLRPLRGALIVIAVAAPYFLLLYLKLGPEPLRTFFVGENLQRFTGSIYAFGARPFWYMFLAFAGDFAPWVFLLFLAIYFDWRTRTQVKTELHARADEEPRARRIVYFWLLFPLVFFSFSNFKLDYYLLPAMPAAAIITGRLTTHAAKLPFWAKAYIHLFSILIAVALLCATIISMKFAWTILDESMGWLAIVLAVAALIASLLLSLNLKGWPLRPVWTLCLGIWLTLCFYELIFAPAFTRYQPVVRLAAVVPTDAHVYTSHGANDWANTLAFHLAPGQTVTRLAQDAENAGLKEILERDRLAVALIKEQEYLRLMEAGVPLCSMAEGETYGHSGLTIDVLRNPRRERLIVVRRELGAGER